MSDFLNTTGALSYGPYEGNQPISYYIFDLDELPKKGYTLNDVSALCEKWANQIVDNEAVSIKLISNTKSKEDCIMLFLSFCSTFSRIKTNGAKDGERRLAPSESIMLQTCVDSITMKRFLNNKCTIPFLRINVYRKKKLLAAL